MLANPLKKDINIQLPEFMLLKASAGSGKTTNLAKRFVQFILSDKIQYNNLKNIIALTFANTATKEMKERILKLLKEVYFNQPKEILEIINTDKDSIKSITEKIIEDILNNFSDFQIKTIDSFMTSVFKSSAIDFGYNSDFEILLNNKTLLKHSFDTFLKKITPDSDESPKIKKIISMIMKNKSSDSQYLWEPSKILFEELEGMYKKLSSIGKKPKIFIHTKKDLEKSIKSILEEINENIQSQHLEQNNNSSYADILKSVNNGKFQDIIDKGIKLLPIKKIKEKETNYEYYKNIKDLWEQFTDKIKDYVFIYSCSYFDPYIEVYQDFIKTVEGVKKQQSKIFIEDINNYLSEYLTEQIVPDIYFRIGETLYHFLIDEFQDTAPIQWNNLKPLLENALSQTGSLFVVGDTKQAIYGFREADYSIMKDCEKDNPFSSATHIISELKVNYRSDKAIVDFSKEIFKREIFQSDNIYSYAAKESGLFENTQIPRNEKNNNGYVETIVVEKDSNNPQEKEIIKKLIDELRGRGYKNGDISILTKENKYVSEISVWLDEQKIPFISYSNLDIRKRKIIREIISLLKFLDSPMDNLSFSSFILSNILNSKICKDKVNINQDLIREFLFKNRGSEILYKIFQSEYNYLWEKYFQSLFQSIGYLPIYDMIAEILKTFEIFSIFQDESSAIIKLLEIIREFENSNKDNIKDFIELAEDFEFQDPIWNMNIPKDIDAVKIMTIHKVKGLQFPIVILLFYAEQNKGFNYIMQDLSTNSFANEINLLKITEKIAEKNNTLKKLYNKEQLKEMVNKLNGLYVGITRAENELYIINVRKQKNEFLSNIILSNETSGNKINQIRSQYSKKDIFELPIIPVYKEQEFDTNYEKTPSLSEKQRGEFIHKVLSLIEYIDNNVEDIIYESIKKAKTSLSINCEDSEIADIILQLFKNQDVKEQFNFKASRIINKEQEFVEENGNLLRIDRLVIDKDKITVIDFKTGKTFNNEKNINQIKIYIKTLKDIYKDKEIQGMLVNIDAIPPKTYNVISKLKCHF